MTPQQLAEAQKRASEWLAAFERRSPSSRAFAGTLTDHSRDHTERIKRKPPAVSLIELLDAVQALDHALARPEHHLPT